MADVKTTVSDANAQSKVLVLGCDSGSSFQWNASTGRWETCPDAPTGKAGQQGLYCSCRQ